MSDEHTHKTSTIEDNIDEFRLVDQDLYTNDIEKYVSWNIDTDAFVKKISREVIEQMECHRLAARYYKTRNDIFQVSMICISGVSSIITVFPDSTPDNPWSPMKIIVKVMSPVVTFLTVLNKYFNFGQTMEQHTNAIKAFRELLSMLQTQLVLPLEDRIQASKFIPAVMKQLSKNMNEYPEIPVAVKKMPVSVPDELDTDTLLKIHKEENVEIPIDPLTRLELAEIQGA